MRGFIEELRYRNVFRVAVAYVVVGWLVAQVADLVVDAFNLPDSFLQMIIVLLLLGFPIAVVLAWAFELTPEGVKRAKDLPDDAPKDPRSGRVLNVVTIVTLVIAVAWLGWDKLQRPTTTDTDTAVGAVDMSIAVLPFADFSPDADHVWFADGLTDEILNALARSRSLRVASRTSSFAYKDTDLDARTIARELDVAHILEGSVRRAGDRIRITAQLIRASDDAHLWSDTFDADSDDSIEIQETIAFEIASLLDTAMDPAEIRRMVDAGTESIAAWEAYAQMRAEHFRGVNNFDPSMNSAAVVELYKKTVAEDPEFSAAHRFFAGVVSGWLSPAYITSGPPGTGPEYWRELFLEASANAVRYARDEESRLGAEVIRAQVQVRLDDYIKYSKALTELRPDDPQNWNNYLGALLMATRLEEARAVLANLEIDVIRHQDFASNLAYVARIDLDRGIQMIETALSDASPTAALLYQAHRIYLYDQQIEKAAEIGRRYIAIAASDDWTLMVRLRQACAEGRIEDAEELYANYDFSGIDVANMNIQWLALKTLGRVDEADALLRPLDEPGLVPTLAQLLTYTHFNPAKFPNLARRLEEQGLMRQEVAPMYFDCKR